MNGAVHTSVWRIRAIAAMAGLAISLSATPALAAPPGPAEGPAPSTSDPSDESYAVRRASQQVFGEIAASIRPSLVRIDTVGGAQPGGVISDDGAGASQPRRQTPFADNLGSRFVVSDGPTTGLVYSSDGYIIASSFNFVRDPALISVTLSDGRRLAADLIARDHVRKLALLKVDADDLVVPPWSDRDSVRVGEWAIALGLGFGGHSPSVTVGIVSALERMRGNAIQTDAKLNPANYGGPLCDVHGRVIGICVPMAQRPGELAGIELYDAGVGFALPRDRVDAIVARLKTGESLYRGWLGIQVEPRSVDAVVVGNIADPSPMREAGVERGDRIVAAEGRRVRHFGHLVKTLYMIPAGDPVHLCIEREDESFDIEVRLARNVDLGPLPEVEEPFDPSEPLPAPDDDDN